MSMDGVHTLRKRQHTRLWYRQLPAPELTEASEFLATPERILSAAEAAAWAELLGENVEEPAPALFVAQRPVAAAPAQAELVQLAKRLGQATPSPLATAQTAELRPRVEED